MKHSNWHLREEIVLRYANGESLRKLGQELAELNYTPNKIFYSHPKVRSSKNKPNFPGVSLIKSWVPEIRHFGFYNLIRDYRMRKRIKFPEDYTKEALEEIIRIQNEIIKKHVGKIDKNDIKKIKNNSLFLLN